MGPGEHLRECAPKRCSCDMPAKNRYARKAAHADLSTKPVSPKESGSVACRGMRCKARLQPVLRSTPENGRRVNLQARCGRDTSPHKRSAEGRRGEAPLALRYAHKRRGVYQ